MFPKIKFKDFCNRHNIEVSPLMRHYDDVSILFKQTDIEHIASTPLKQFIYINFKYKPFNNSYNEEWDNDGITTNHMDK